MLKRNSVDTGSSLEETLYKFGIILLPIGILAFILYDKLFLSYFDGIPCVLYYFCGIYCPGCGGTRAIKALLDGAILQSVWYHPLVLYVIILYGGFMLTHTLERFSVKRIRGWRFHSWYLYVALIVLIANFLIKNILLLCFHISM